MISSIENIKIKKYVALCRKKKWRNKLKKFAIEGVRFIFDAMEYGVDISELFVTGACLAKLKNSKFNIVSNYPLEVISDSLAKKISMVENSQGIFAIADKPVELDITTISRTSKILAICGVSDPGNLGTLIRSACAFNFDGVVLSEDCCDLFNPKVLRTSVGAVFKIKIFVSSNFSEFLNDIKAKLDVFASVVDGDAKPAKILNGKTGMIIVGSEAEGIPEEIIKQCRTKITIKMSYLTESLNVAVAGSILMYCLNQR